MKFFYNGKLLGKVQINGIPNVKGTNGVAAITRGDGSVMIKQIELRQKTR